MLPSAAWSWAAWSCGAASPLVGVTDPLAERWAAGRVFIRSVRGLKEFLCWPLRS